jgi:hypothetical protein
MDWSWTPSWWARTGPILFEGKGLLSDPVSRIGALLDSFGCFLEPSRTDIRLDLQTGVFSTNGRPMSDPFPGSARNLIWGRRMRQDIGGPAVCLFYLIGWDNGKVRKGYRITESGELIEGLG